MAYSSITYYNHPAVPGGVFAQRVSPSGERIGPRLALDTSDNVNCLFAVPSGPGRLLVAWGEYSYPTDTIYARHFDFQGNPLSPKVQVGTSSSYVPTAAACDAEGRCWIAWIPEGVASIRARRLDADGQLLGQEIRVDSSPGPGAGYVERYEIELSADPQGGFVAAWWNGSTATGTPEDPPTPPTGEIHIRRFTAAGEPLGDELLLDTGSEFAYNSPSVCHLANGGFFVAASRVRPDFVSPYEVVLRRFDAAGVPAGPEQIVTVSAGHTGSLDLSCGPDGALLLWRGEALFGRHFSLTGEPSGAPILISNGGSRASAALLGSGRFLVAWEVYLPDSTDIYARVYGSATSALPLHGGRFHVEATFRDPRTGITGAAESRPLTNDTGLLWFFDSANVELVVKVLEGCEVNDHFWFFAAG
ncbi:MAG TPA: hypothetical protein VL025_04335, partial [Thermoanaerobaculia bacterium]|nr:hypothetical protein [Thermoanaerobaculia bacterium]